MKIKGIIGRKLYPQEMFVDLEKYEKLEKENEDLKSKIEEYKNYATKYYGFTKEWEKDYNKLKAEKDDQINELKNTIERQEIMIGKMKLCHKCKHKEPPYILCSVCDGEVMFEEVK